VQDAWGEITALGSSFNPSRPTRPGFFKYPNVTATVHYRAFLRSLHSASGWNWPTRTPQRRVPLISQVSVERVHVPWNLRSRFHAETAYSTGVAPPPPLPHHHHPLPPTFPNSPPHLRSPCPWTGPHPGPRPLRRAHQCRTRASGTQWRTGVVPSVGILCGQLYRRALPRALSLC
jgi:hypothetical protein